MLRGSRCRPILITTATTLIRLTPLVLSRNPAVAQMSPMVVSPAFGVLVSSLAALLFVPALWLSLHAIGNRIRRTTGRLADAIGRAPRMAQRVTNYPFVQDSLKSSEFTELLVEEDEDMAACRLASFVSYATAGPADDLRALVHARVLFSPTQISAAALRNCAVPRWRGSAMRVPLRRNLRPCVRSSKRIVARRQRRMDS